MRLEFKSPYLSISNFTPIDLPDLSVLTGVNGSGKSHLLTAIKRGNVVVSGVNPSSIVLFNYESFRLENEGAYNAQQLFAEREAGWQFYQQSVKPHAANWRAQIGGDYSALSNTAKENKKSLLDAGGEKVRQYFVNAKNHLLGKNFQGNSHAKSLLSLTQRLPYSLDELKHEDFLELYKPFDYKNDFLPQHLGKIIWDYYVKYRNNQVNEFQASKYGKKYSYVSEEDFVVAHGPKPWELMNEILEKFDSLDYRITTPEGIDVFGNFQLKLVHLKNPQLEIDFSSLSSGEKILMALVASVYKASTDDVFPDVLLLDEVDASLHPSMMKNMLDVIAGVFLARSIKVVLVTHSPTTIALAPEDSVFVMNKSGSERIQKRSRSEALSILTEGFATLDEGIKLFDEISRNQLSVISEGNNSLLLKKALELHGCDFVQIVTGFEAISGKGQLKTLFDFFSKAMHKNKVIFVWDCDATYSLEPVNNTYPYTLSRNSNNTLATRGIENMFPEGLFEKFKKTITRPDGSAKHEFDESYKKEFQDFVIGRNCIDDFINFVPFVKYVRSLSG